MVFPMLQADFLLIENIFDHVEGPNIHVFKLKRRSSTHRTSTDVPAHGITTSSSVVRPSFTLHLLHPRRTGIRGVLGLSLTLRAIHLRRATESCRILFG